jgi:transcription elongation factor Elf1
MMAAAARFQNTKVFSMAAYVTAPKSHIYEWYFGRSPCPKCGELLSAPAYSEFLKRNNVRHTWICNKCDYEFETLIWLNIPPGS